MTPGMPFMAHLVTARLDRKLSDLPIFKPHTKITEANPYCLNVTPTRKIRLTEVVSHTVSAITLHMAKI